MTAFCAFYSTRKRSVFRRADPRVRQLGLQRLARDGGEEAGLEGRRREAGIRDVQRKV